MLRIVFLCSGGGGNLRFMVEAIRLGLIVDAEVSAVITDRECPAGLFARKNNIPVSECDYLENGQRNLINVLNDLDPGVVVTNVHKILSPELVNIYKDRLINLHYSILPSFGGVIGVKALSQALDYGVKLVGTTVHMVDDFVDTGLPLVQSAIPIVAHEDLNVLMDVVFRVGCVSLLAGLCLIRGIDNIAVEGRCALMEVSGRSVLFNPPVFTSPCFQDELFWERLR